MKVFRHLVFRILQLFRVINNKPNIGITYILQFIIIIFIKIENNNYYPFIFVIPIFLWHFGRKDIYFIEGIFDKKYQFVMFLEYIFIYTVISFGNVYYQIDKSILYPLPILGSLILLKKSKLSIEEKGIYIFPLRYFEINSAFRKNPITFILIILFWGVSGYHPFTLFLMGIIILDFIGTLYTPNECKEMLIGYFRNKNLKAKIIEHLKIYNLCILVVFLVYINGNENNLPIYFIIYTLILNIFIILIIMKKYKEYNYKEKENEYNSGIYLKYLILSCTFLGILKIFQDYLLANKNIHSYVGSQ